MTWQMLTQCLKSPEGKKKTKHQFPQMNGRIPEKCRRVTVKHTHIYKSNFTS